MELVTKEHFLAEMQKLRNMMDIRFRNIEEQLKELQGEEDVH